MKNGLQSQWIQPLVIRGNQGDCVKMTPCAIAGGRRGSQPQRPRLQHGGGIYRAACDDDRPRRHRAAEKAVELEWYIPPTQQEGGRQFHSYSHDQEPQLGLFGTFCDRTKGSNIWIRSARASHSR